MKKICLLALFAFALAARAEEPKDFTQETPEQKAERFAWFNQAKFGMFIHWGLYSVPAGEHGGNKGYGEWFVEETKIPMHEYEQFTAQFNPTNFNAREWVRVAKAAGMRYICITSKHHDGFGLWNSKLGDWNIGRTPFKNREPLKELADACKAEGLTFCLYHSIMDWHHPLYGNRRAYNDTAKGDVNMPEYVEYMKGQLKEIVTQFGPLGILWFDGGWEKSWTDIPNHGPDLFNYCRSLQPSLIVNDRGGKGDYGTPEQTIPGAAPKNAWETCMTLNGHWGYNKADHNWKSTTMLIRNLIDCASKGGNYLLNVGPTGDGLIPFESVSRLQEIGAWMKQNGDAIYGTIPGPFRKLDFGAATIKDDKLFIFVLDAPTDRKLYLTGLSTQVKRAYFLADSHKHKLDVEANEAGPIITLPNYPPECWNEHANVIVCECDGKPESAANLIPQAADGSVTLIAKEAEVEGEGPAAYENGNGKDNIGNWTNEKNIVTWSAKITKAGKFKVTPKTKPGLAVMNLRSLTLAPAP